MAENKLTPTSLPVSEREVELLKSIFKGNEYLLKVVRKLFFGFKLSDEDKKLVLKSFAGADVRLAFRKKIYPVALIDNMDAPIGQLTEYWLGTEQNILGQHKDTIFQTVVSKKKLLTLLDNAFDLLVNPDAGKIDLTYDPTLIADDEFQTFLLARNLFIKTVEQGLIFVKAAAESENKVTEEVKQAAKKNSNR